MFEHEILFSDLSEEEAKQKEIQLIDELHTRNPDFGYNMTPGGDGYSGQDNPWYGKHHTEESKKKMSKARKGVPKSEETKIKIGKALEGRKFSDETRRKMSENHADFSGENNPMYGRKMDPNHLQKMIAASKTPEAIEKMKQHKQWYSGKDNPNAKQVLCIETGIVYTTINEAAEATGCCASKISSVCHGKREHTRGLHFKIVKDDEND